MTGLLLIAFLSAAAGDGASYAWPLDLPQQLSSSFGEYRPGRFHAGIDLRTGGETGKTVYAPADGYVTRVRCSPYGYGKALYIQLQDGNLVIFGHLMSFAPAINEYVQRAQHEKESYTVELSPAPNQFPVKRGEIVAYSGQTGIGVPHLHYEIRDASNRPIHPWQLGIRWPDADAPVISKALVVPRGPDSRVNGDLLPLVLPLQRGSDGTYRAPAISASGSIGIGIDVIDPANAGANKLGVYTVDATIGDHPLFAIKNDFLSYDTMQDGVVSYYPFLQDKGRFLLQWRWPGNRAESFAQSSGEGWFSVEMDADAVITAADEHWNKGVAVIPIRLGAGEEVPFVASEASSTAGIGTVTIACFGDWLAITAAFTQPEGELPRLDVSGAALAEGGEFFRVDERNFRAGVKPQSVQDWLTLNITHPRIGEHVEHIAYINRSTVARDYHFGDVRMRAGGDSAYGALFAKVTPLGTKLETPIPLRGEAYRIWPEDSPIDAPVRLSFPLPANAKDASRLSVYRQSGSGWSRLSTTRTGERLSTETRSLGVFAALEDHAAPRVRIVNPLEDLSTERRPPIAALVSDVGSGIADVVVTANGEWLLGAYDPERDVVIWERDEDLPTGQIEVVVRATDHAGNTTVASRKIRIQP